jgi:glucosamine--fructose-6-phosphate aminotransferase (isomerizing)
MCGIVGAVTDRNIESVLIEGLKRLEYRGYDSAGLALIDHQSQLKRIRTLGKVRELENSLQQAQLHGKSGIAHTRWATHGMPSEQNAHPLMSADELCLVHNGIIENHEELKTFLLEKGYQFTSETDSETIVHLLHFHLQQSHDLLQATKETVAKLEGAYALCILSKQNPERIIGVRHGSPLVVGKGSHENFFASDPLALLPVTKKFIYLEEGDIADLTKESITIYDANHQKVERKIHLLEIKYDMTDRGEHRHYMSKEIFEQPQAITLNLEGRINNQKLLDTAFGIPAKNIFKQVEHVQLVACGTSYHAALVAKSWIETLANIPCSVEIASEFRYRHNIVRRNSLFVTLSQSGETADTLAALRLAKKNGYLHTLAVCNVPESSLTRESDLSFMMRAGVEVCVASTKAFTAQLVDLLLLALALGREHGMSHETERHITSELLNLPKLVHKTLEINETIAKLSENFVNKEHALFLGRGLLYPIALEGALKLKEISYIHAEGYPAGELKHGPLALVDHNMPVIAIAPNNHLLEKLKSNLQEVRARGGELYVFTDIVKTKDSGIHIIEMPTVDPILAPIIYTIPLQLLAYHVAVMKGTDVDQPRNLAKSVTVE